MSNNFELIIKTKKRKSSLEEKHVSVKGNDNFSRDTTNDISSQSKSASKKTGTDTKNESTTMDKGYKATVNDILNLLLDNYVNTKFYTRQQEAFNSMYNTQIELLKK